jgi:dipeptidyl aminopeptidase/acylaminoacyl peptidase
MPMTDEGPQTMDEQEHDETGPTEFLDARQVLPYGEWPSPVTSADVARSRVHLSFPTVIRGDVWWQENLPDEDGRVAVMFRAAGGKENLLLPAPWDARTRVHEYGGRSYLPVPQPARGGSRAMRMRAVVFANFADQRLYLAGREAAEGRAAPLPLSPDPVALGLAAGALRYADFVLSPDEREIWCVHERHESGAVTRSIVAVPLDGSAAGDAGAVRTIVSGADFFAFPTPSPDGTRLAWISWNHPHMPWDGTELRVAVLADGVAGPGRLLQGSIRESVLAPVWKDNSSLYVATDWTGWWNIYELDLAGRPPQALFPADEEFAGPLWNLGGRPFAMLGDGRLAVVHGQGGSRLGILDPETCELTEVDVPFSEFDYAVSADGQAIAGIAGGPLQPASVVRLDAATGKTEVLRQALESLPEIDYLPVPRARQLEGRYGRVVHALVYPPTSPDVTGPDGELPPYVVWVHGGPTAGVRPLLDLEKAYFTSRGIGVIDVNYGGSTGYGRSYRERLRRQWGVVDVEDAAAAAQSLADSGEADARRLAVRGGSAGGWTALAAVTTGAAGPGRSGLGRSGRGGAGTVFGAAASYFGVADLLGLAEETHDFESRYLDGMVGPLPGFEAVYAERSPLGHVSGATPPVLLLQGLDDPVVPPAQARAIAAELAKHGITHAHLTFEGEAHGFRKAETIMAAVEAELSFYGQVLGFEPPGVPRLPVIKG